MSSRNDSSGYNSLNDSIPLDTEQDEDSVGMEESEEYSQSVYTGTSLREHSERSSSYHAGGSRSRTTALSRVTGASGEYTATSYLSPSDPASDSYYNAEDDEYSSNYRSLTYDESALRSPRSSSVLSSTMASLYHDHSVLQKTWDTLSFLRRPLFFLAFVTGGGSVVSGVGRLMASVPVVVSTALPTVAPSPQLAPPHLAPQHLARLPSGYPDVPDWLREVRAALPTRVEQSVTWCLRKKGIPVLSELQQRQQTMTTPVLVAAPHPTPAPPAPTSAPAVMLPAAIFLPVFSYAVLLACKCILARQTHANTFLYQPHEDEAEDEGLSVVEATPRDSTVARDSGVIEDVTDTHLATPTRASSLPTTSHAQAVEDVERVQSSASQPSRAVPDPALTLSAIPHANTTLRSVPVLEEAEAALRDPITAAEGRLSPHSVRSTASLPSTVGPSASQPAPRRVTRESDPINTADDDRGGSEAPSVGGAGAAAGGRFRGSVVAALVGDAATVHEVNALLVAAAKYGCRAVLLPQSCSNLPGLLPPPSTLSVQYASHVLRAVGQLTQRSALRCVAVFAPAVAAAVVQDGAVVDLPQLTHPEEALYVFVAAADASALGASVAAVAQTHVRTRKTASLRATEELGTLVNECFYDRLAKERQVRLAERAVNRAS